MAHMTEEEKNEIRRDIRKEGQRAFQIAYGIIGGGMMAVVSVFGALLQQKGCHSFSTNDAWDQILVPRYLLQPERQEIMSS
jgi:hypothetical protein